jgi:flagellar capping protein FliD
MKIYNFDTQLTEGKFKNNPKTVREAFEDDSKIIFKLIKKYGYNFSDDVLAEAGIRKTVRDKTFTNVIVEHDQVKPDNKKYKKDKKSIDEILDEICDEHNNFKEDDSFNFSSLENDINNIEMPIEPEI